jgi:hypothetical protein
LFVGHVLIDQPTYANQSIRQPGDYVLDSILKRSPGTSVESWVTARRLFVRLSIGLDINGTYSLSGYEKPEKSSLSWCLSICLLSGGQVGQPATQEKKGREEKKEI